LDDFVTPGEAARQPDGAHAGLGAAVGHANFLHAGHAFADHFGHGEFERVRNAEGSAVIGGGLGGADDIRMSVDEHGGVPREHIIDQVISVGVPNMRTGGLGHEKGMSSHGAKGAYGGIDTAGNIFQ